MKAAVRKKRVRAVADWFADVVASARNAAKAPARSR